MPRTSLRAPAPRPSYDSQATASDATLDLQDADEKAPLPRYTDEDDNDTSAAAQPLYPPRSTSRKHTDPQDDIDDDDIVRIRLDDDEQVSLMQADRDGRSLDAGGRGGPAWARLAGSAGRFAKRRRPVSAGCLICAGVLLGFFLGVPALQWLSGASSSVGSAASSLFNPHKGEDVVSDTRLDAGSSSSSASSQGYNTSFWKQGVSSNDQAGRYGLSNAAVFQLDFQDPGWDTVAQASSGTGLSVEEVTSFKTHDGKDLMPLDMDTVFGGTLVPLTSDLVWSEEDPDEGVFTHVDWNTRDIWLEDVTHARHEKTGQGKVASFGGKVRLLEGKNVLDARGQMLTWTSFKISPDMKWVLFFSDESQQWRYSKHSHLWLHNVVEKQTMALGAGAKVPPKVSYAEWAPRKAGVSSSDPPGIAFVENNDLYFIPRAGEAAVQVTHDGAETIFNAVPDWVYEEEVYGGESVMWFSPGGTKLVYLRLDETAVPVYEFPVYNPNKYLPGKTTPYQEMVKMKYPKPGFPNPIVSVHVIDLDEIKEATRKGAAVKPTQYTLHGPRSDKGKITDEVDRILSSDAGIKNRLVSEVKWVSDDQLVLRETDRYSDVMRIVLFDLAKQSLPKPSPEAKADVEGKVVRRQDARKDQSGWIRAGQTIEPLSHHDLSVGSTAYLDVLVSPEGYRHLAFFESAASDTAVFLTAGQWEIDELKHVDAKRGKAYFIAARPTPALRNLYSVDLPDWKKVGTTTAAPVADSKPKEPTALTDVAKFGSYDANFDPKGAYYVLNYKGPDVPYQKVVGVDDPKFELGLEDNQLLRQISSQYVKPSNVFYSLALNSTTSEGKPVLASVKEIRPHDFDASGATRYPVLMRVYGGPDSQLVDARWNRADWHQYVASTLGYIVVVVDGRGTGFRGQQHRASVASNLGKLEAKDVNDAAHLIATLPYVDETRIGLWGWSYGGYLTGKSVELNTGIFSLAASVAPVTRWELYDSIYTERYMKSPVENQKGYSTSEIHVTPGFTKTKYLLMQGSADDNVHFSNSAHLLDLLTKAKTRGFRFRMFTDSAHSISVRGAYRELFEELSAFLADNWGPGGRRQPPSTTPQGGKGKGRQGLHNSVE